MKRVPVKTYCLAALIVSFVVVFGFTSTGLSTAALAQESSTVSLAAAQDDRPAGAQDSEQTKQDDAQNKPLSGWHEQGGKRFFYHEDGSVHTGWLYVDGHWYWADTSTAEMAKGWRLINNAWYWFSPQNGTMAASRTLTNGKWSDFSSSGAWNGYASGWDYRDGKWYWLESGVRASGWRYIRNTWYWMDAQAQGACVQNQIRQINGAWYAFNSSGAMGKGGWCVADGSWCLASDLGVLKRGWQYLNGIWYCIDPGTYRMCTGYLRVGNKSYYFKPSGEMALGWAYDTAQRSWYYAQPSSSDGHLLSGWQKLNGKWYYLDPATHKMSTGWLTVADTSYYLEGSGAMASSCWKQREAQTCWLDASGRVSVIQEDNHIRFANGTVPQDGLTKLGDSWFYLLNNTVQYGTQVINGKTHVFDAKTGRALSGWYTPSKGQTYYYSEQGQLCTGWVKVKGTWYYLNSQGVLLKGWQQLAGVWYYLDPSNGSMHTGWLHHTNHWYWLDNSGAMAKGWKTIGSMYFYFDQNTGALHDPQQKAETQAQRSIVQAAYATPSPGGGLCAMWVSQVYSRAGLGYPDGNACDMFWNYCSSSNLYDLKVGMIIAVPSHMHTYLGGIYGHVCIYVGNDTVIDNVGYVRTMPLIEWLDYYTTTHSPKWGWASYSNLG